MINFSQKGDFSKTEKFLNSCTKNKYQAILDRYARQGVDALSAATPTKTGTTANSWSYEIEIGATTSTIVWTNSHIVNGVNIALILQYGHATRNGGFVQGVDYINPALRSVFNDLADAVWKEVTAV